MPDAPPYSVGGIVALIVFGLLLLIPSGLCSGAIGVMAIWAALTQSGGGEALSTLPMVAIIGGPFIVGGGAMLLTGIRRARANRHNSTTPT